jgi:protein TonB
MTPEKRFFPARDDDELKVHDDFLAAHGDDPCGEVLCAQNAPAGQDIENRQKAVHGKNDLPGTRKKSSSFETSRFLVSVICATLMHALVLGAVGTWLGMGGEGGGGPMLMALELSGGSGGGTGMQTGGLAAAGGASQSMGAASAPSALAELAAQPPKRAASPDITHQAPAKVATKKPEPTPVPKKPVRTNSPAAAKRKETAPQTSPPPQEPAKNFAQDAGTLGTSGLEAAGTESQAAARSDATSGSSGASGGSGGPGNGPVGASGSGNGGNAADGPGAGGSLIRFNSPGGPGIVRLARPRYPYEARRLGKEGIVLLKLSLDAMGSVSDVEVLEGGGFGMEEASREAVMLSRFRPATVKGRPVPCQAILPIHFTLR